MTDKMTVGYCAQLSDKPMFELNLRPAGEGMSVHTYTDKLEHEVLTLTEALDALRAARTKDQNEVYELIQDLFSARCFDGENGVAWLNDEASKEWVEKNEHLHKAMQALACRVEAWVMEDEEAPA